MAHPMQAIERALAQDRAGRTGPAIAALERLCGRKGAPAEAHHFLGMLLAKVGRIDQALFHLDRARSLAPRRVQFLTNHANVLAQCGKADEAIELYACALKYDAAAGRAYVGLGSALLGMGRLGEALEAARRGVAYAPENIQAFANLASCLIVTGHSAHAVALLEEATERLGPEIALYTLLAAAMHYDNAGATRSNLDLHKDLGRLCAMQADRIGLKKMSPAELLRARAERKPPIRVGFLSADFRDHPVASFVEPMLESDASITVSCFDVTPVPDAFSRVYKAQATARGVCWHDAQAASDVQLVEMVRDAQIDVLIELAGYTLGHRQVALAARMAPVQVSFLGYPSTTGNPAIDARIVDSISDPAGTDSLATEKLIRLDPCAWCYQPPTGDGGQSAVHGSDCARTMKESPIIFGSFNNLAKTVPAVLDTWAAVLARVADSRLCLKNAAFVDVPTQESMREALVRRGVASERIELLGPTPDTESHLALYRRIDIALDTFAYAGTTTTCEALWMGVPVVSLAGNTHAGRVGASLLGAIGLGEDAGSESLVARTPEAYVNLAANLAADRDRLGQLHASLRQRMEDSKLMDRTHYRTQMVGAIGSLWADVHERAQTDPSARRDSNRGTG